jgi:hypothetical protein
MSIYFILPLNRSNDRHLSPHLHLIHRPQMAIQPLQLDRQKPDILLLDRHRACMAGYPRRDRNNRQKTHRQHNNLHHWRSRYPLPGICDFHSIVSAGRRKNIQAADPPLSRPPERFHSLHSQSPTMASPCPTPSH